MAITIVFANQKGGVGKTTSAVNLGAYIAEAGKRVLLVDFDPQGNLSSSVGADKTRPGVYELLTGSIEPRAVVQTTDVTNLSIVPTTSDLTGANVELVDQQRREYFLRKALAPLSEDYDYIFIDCPPSLGILTLNGLVAADRVFIPMQCEYFALEGLTQLMESIRLVQKRFNTRLVIGGIFFTMYDSRIRIAQQVVREVIGYFGSKVFQTIIPRNVRLSEAPSHGVPINKYDPNCVGARNYQKLAEEVIARG
ncbi:ParA family protein [Spirochaeta africana]|uniref:ATPase involved in chromosome partitioning n=1 Tax=Spirochaeta africana (strain ATCC 700263 / DSM 8902 / Z-7692) TaxID=889378 RepID=H9UMZ5_SPIAZ|nr:ParA family protein [Spirochaeta africana]AFG38888.1 ATPase involved in chromosome partitioning [Spirochaeta africana DSM 8902]